MANPPGPATLKLTKLVTSEMMQFGKKPVICFCGACNIIGEDGIPYRNKGRDELLAWAEMSGISFYEVQIHESTHGRGYVYEIDGKHEQAARREAKLRVYEIRPEVTGIVTFMELMQDAALGRPGIVWVRENGWNFKHPIVGGKNEIRNNFALAATMPKAHFGVFGQLAAQADLQRKTVYDFIIGDMSHTSKLDFVFEDDLEAVTAAIKFALNS